MLVNGLRCAGVLTGPGGPQRYACYQRGWAAPTLSTPPVSPPGQIKLSIDAGDGDDVVVGSGGDDLIHRGNDNDVLVGAAGNDTLFGGAGNDRMFGTRAMAATYSRARTGRTLLTFNGANFAENVDISANGSRVRFFRDVAASPWISTRRGDRATDARRHRQRDGKRPHRDRRYRGRDRPLGASGGGDGQADTVTINDSANATGLLITDSGQSILVHGGVADVFISGQDVIDTLQVNGLGGADIIDASTLSGLAASRCPSMAEIATTSLSAAPVTIRSSEAAATTRLSSASLPHLLLEPGRRQRHGRRSGRYRYASLQRRQYRRKDRYLRQRRGTCGSPAT